MIKNALTICRLLIITAMGLGYAIVPAGLSHAASLQIIATIPTSALNSTDPLPVTITFTNRGSASIAIPILNRFVAQTYLTISVTHESGIPIFFMSSDLDSLAPGAIAAGTQTIAPGAAVTYTEVLNDSGVGYLGYSTGNQPILEVFSGRFTVVATFSVSADTLPPGTGPNAFLGSVSSTDTGPAKVVALLAGDLNGDGKVDCIDIGIVRSAFGAKIGQANYDLRADVNRDGVVNVQDLAFVAQQLPPGTQCH